jgi:MFS family permease
MFIKERFNFIKSNRLYLLYIVDFFSSTGDWLTIVAMMVLVYKDTKSVASLSMILMMRMLPTMIFSFLGGVLADRLDRKRLLIITQVIRGCVLSVLFFCLNNYLLYAVAFVTSALSAIAYPAIHSLIPNLVDKKDLIKANSLFSVGEMFGALIGPAIAAILIDFFNVKVTFLIDALSFFLYGIILLKLPKIASVKNNPRQDRKTIIKESLEGLRYLLENKKSLLVILGVGVSYFTMGALATLELAFSVKVLGLNENAYGYLIAATAIGAIITLFFIEKIHVKYSFRVFLIGVAVFGVAIILYGLQTHLLAVIPILFLMGCGEASFTVGSRSFLQINVDRLILGKTMSNRNLMQRTGMLLGSFFGGICSSLFPNVSIANILILVGVILVVFFVFSVLSLKKVFSRAA